MKLVPFSCVGSKISVNPQHVVTVRAAAGEEKSKTVIFLVTGGQITVDCPVAEVIGKLATAS